MRRFAVELSTIELDVVWRSEPFGDLPLIIDVPSPGATHAERAALETRVWTDLIERELADNHGRATSRVTRGLSVIARRRRSLQLRTFGPQAFRAILAQRGGRAVLGLLDNERIRLANVSDTGLTDTLLSLLPDLLAGPGHSVSVTATGLAEAARADGPATAQVVLRRHGLNRIDARTLLDMTTGSIRTGQIAAELRAADGRMTRSPRVIAFHDTPSGRYQTLSKTSGSTVYLTITPASLRTLTRSIHELTTGLLAVTGAAPTPT